MNNNVILGLKVILVNLMILKLISLRNYGNYFNVIYFFFKEN